MQYKKIIKIFLIVCNFSMVGFGQLESPILFEEERHVFGNIREEDGPVTHEFKFKNDTKEDIVLSNVKASCGCTTPAWSREPVHPGSEGFIKVQYNPRNRPGPFKKSLTVRSNRGVSVLYIEGQVVPKEKTPEEEFPKLMGSLRFKNDKLYIGKITSNGKITRIYDIYNEGNKPVNFLKDKELPEHIEVNIVPEIIKPGGKAKMQIIFDPVKRNKLGYGIDHIRLKTNDVLQSELEFSIMAHVNEYFPPYSDEEYALQPNIELDELAYDFGDIHAGDTVQHVFTITNTGKQNLNLRTIIPNCECVTARAAQNDILPGQQTSLTVTYFSTSRRGTQHKNITIYSNDPRKSVLMLTVQSTSR